MEVAIQALRRGATDFLPKPVNPTELDAVVEKRVRSQSCADGKEHVAEVHERRLGGDFLVSTTPLCDKQGRRTGTVHVARDITERKKMEEGLRASKRNWNGSTARWWGASGV
jgi:DNA-binding NtrC family response regulator